jgi:hypothetical protein
MNKARIIVIVAVCFIAAGWLTLSASQAGDKKSSAREVTFNKDVAPIFFAKCAECHRPGEAAPFSVLSYKDARPWARSIKEKVVNREMPPWHADPHIGEFANDRRLTPQQIEAITAWVDQGAKEGAQKDLPPAPQFVDGWSIGKPDVILSMPEEFTLDAEGPDEYQYFDIPTNFTEDKYVALAEARPGNRKIVHHIIAFVVPPGQPNTAKMTREQRDKAVESSLKNSPFYRDGFLIRMKPDQPVLDDLCGATVEKPPVAKVDPKIYDAYVGRYDLGNGRVYHVTKEGGKLMSQIPGNPPFELLPETETQFFWREARGRLIFVKDEKGEVNEIIFDQGIAPAHAKRIKDAAAGGK